MGFVSLLLLVAQTAGVPVVGAIDPPTVAPYQPAELTIRGEGFEAGCRVLIGVPGRLVPVRCEIEDPSAIRVHLTAGLSPDPPTRHVVVDCGRGRRSAMLPLTVATTDEAEDRAEPDNDRASVAPPPTEENDKPSSATAAGTPPRITSLDPATALSGEPFTLTLMGENFRDGAEVEVLANTHAGTSRDPEYRALAFPAELASDTVLLVDFDRGFAASPRLRSVTVVNPDGGRSPPLYLKITRSLP